MPTLVSTVVQMVTPLSAPIAVSTGISEWLGVERLNITARIRERNVDDYHRTQDAGNARATVQLFRIFQRVKYSNEVYSQGTNKEDCEQLRLLHSGHLQLPQLNQW